MITAVQELHDQGAKQYIVSDANTVFIDVILKARGIKALFPDERIFTNKAWFADNGKLEIRRYHAHECVVGCPQNMCKGSIIKAIEKEEAEGMCVCCVCVCGNVLCF